MTTATPIYVSSDVPASKQKNHVLNVIFAQIKYSLQYDELWEGENLEDKILGANIDMPSIPVGRMSKSESPEGRKFVFIGTRFGTVTICDNGEYHTYSFPANPFFDLLFYKDAVGLPDHKFMLGWGTNRNLGLVIEDMAKLLQASEA